MNAAQSKAARESAAHAAVAATIAAVYAAPVPPSLGTANSVHVGGRGDAINCMYELKLLVQRAAPATALTVIAIDRAVRAGNDSGAIDGLIRMLSL